MESPVKAKPPNTGEEDVADTTKQGRSLYRYLLPLLSSRSNIKGYTPLYPPPKGFHPSELPETVCGQFLRYRSFSP